MSDRSIRSNARRHRRGPRPLMKMALRSETIERSLARLGELAVEDRDALRRLEASLLAAAAEARRLAARGGRELETFTEHRSDEDWRREAGRPEDERSRPSLNAMSEVEDQGSEEFSEF